MLETLKTMNPGHYLPPIELQTFKGTAICLICLVASNSPETIY